ncbi:MAG: hypothetical protein ACREYC_21915 [Gammaproteobacteria bacterium]
MVNCPSGRSAVHPALTSTVLTVVMRVAGTAPDGYVWKRDQPTTLWN